MKPTHSFSTQIWGLVFKDIILENVNSWINFFDIHNILDDKILVILSIQ